VISFLRGLLINHDTQPQPDKFQSKPIAPLFSGQFSVVSRQFLRNAGGTRGTAMTSPFYR